MKDINISKVIKQIKDYQQMQDEVRQQIEALKTEAIEYLDENKIDEYMCDEGKITYREVQSSRFNTTAFKKDFLDIYKEYCKQTSNMRFTCS